MPTPGDPNRAGARRGAPAKRQVPTAAVALAGAALVSLVAWGVLVWIAIDFGRSARGGDSVGWWWLVLASLGAVASLLVCLLLTTMALRRIGILAPRQAIRH